MSKNTPFDPRPAPARLGRHHRTLSLDSRPRPARSCIADRESGEHLHARSGQTDPGMLGGSAAGGRQ